MVMEKLAPRHLGYGLYWMWTLLCFQSTAAFIPFGGGLETILDSSGDFFFCSLVATVLAHPFWAAVLALRPQLCRHAPWVGAVVTGLSIVAVGLVPATPLALVALGVISGVSSALLDVRWLQTMGALPETQSGRAICASLCVALLGYQPIALLGRASAALCITLIAVLPLASAAALGRCCAQGEGQLDKAQVRAAAHNARQIAGTLVWPVVGSLAFFFVEGCVQGITSAHTDFDLLHSVTLASELAATALMYLALRRSRRLEANKLYALVMALVSAGFLTLPIALNSGTEGGLFAAATLVSTGTMIIDVVVLCAIARAAFDWRAPGAIVGGVARGVTVGVMGVGHFVGVQFSEGLWSGNVDAVVFIVSITYLLILCCVLYFSHIRGAKDDIAAIEGAPAQAASEALPAKGANAHPGATPDAAATDEPSGEATGEEALFRRVEAVAFEHHLSRRETDVFALIARGRSVPYTAQALVLSENTVRSHVRRIYNKLGVHSKQELLNLVEHDGTPDSPAEP